MTAFTAHGTILRKLVDEAWTLLFLRHPYVVGFHGIWDLPCDFFTRTFLVVEFCDFQVGLGTRTNLSGRVSVMHVYS